MSTAPKINDVLPVKASPHKRFFIDMITRDIFTRGVRAGFDR